MGISISAFAKVVGVSRQAVSKRIANGTLPTEADGTLDQQRAMRAWYATSRTSGQPGTMNGHAGTLHAARAARETLAARLLELDYRKRAGELVEAEDVVDAGFRVGRVLREALEVVPDRLAALVAGRPMTECHRIIRREVHAVIDQLAAAETQPRGRRRSA